MCYRMGGGQGGGGERTNEKSKHRVDVHFEVADGTEKKKIQRIVST